MSNATDPSFHLETPRLVLRHLQAADAPHLFTYRSDPEVARYQSWVSMTADEAQRFVAQQAESRPGIPGEWFQFAVALKETNQLIGDCAMKTIQELGQPMHAQQAEIGYTFSRDYQRQGLATEAISALLDYIFGTLNLHRVIAITDCRNAASIALLSRLGFRREARFIEGYWLKGTWIDEYLYAILKREWGQKSR